MSGSPNGSRQRRTRAVRGAVLVCVLALLAAACGSSGDESAVAERERPAETAVGGEQADQGAATEGAPLPQAATGDAAEESASSEELVTLPPPEGPVSVDPGVNAWVETAADAQSTFATDVDTASYALARAAVERGALPDPASVRVEEFVNALPGGYQAPDEGFAIHLDGMVAPLRSEPEARLLRVGLQAAVPPGPRPPIALTFVVDTSGSMGSEGRLELVRRSLDVLAQRLEPDDRVALVTFSDTARVVLEPTPAREQGTIRSALARLVTEQSTNVEAGLRLGYETASSAFLEGGTNRVVLASDGIANTGLTDPEGLLDVIHQGAGAGLSLVTVGVGTAGYHDALMERLADDGDGFATYVDSLEEAQRVFAEELAVTAATVALDAKVQVRFDPSAVQRYRLLGYENRDVADADFRSDEVDAGLVTAGQSVTALYEVVPRPGTADATWAEVVLRFTDPASRAPVEVREAIGGADVLDAASADGHLRLAAAGAAYAEVLRASPYAAHLRLGDVAAQADAVASALPGATEAAELARLAAAADQLQ